IFYFVPVAFLVYHTNPKAPFWAAGVCTFLSLMGYVLSPESNVSNDITLLNRFFAIIAMWVISYQVREIIKNKNQFVITSWLRGGATELAEKIKGELSVKEVADLILEFFELKTEAKVGVVYLKDEQGILNFLTGRGAARDSV